MDLIKRSRNDWHLIKKNESKLNCFVSEFILEPVFVILKAKSEKIWKQDSSPPAISRAGVINSLRMTGEGLLAMTLFHTCHCERVSQSPEYCEGEANSNFEIPKHQVENGIENDIVL